jgi:hypothetical protein
MLAAAIRLDEMQLGSCTDGARSMSGRNAGLMHW